MSSYTIHCDITCTSPATVLVPTQPKINLARATNWNLVAVGTFAMSSYEIGMLKFAVDYVNNSTVLAPNATIRLYAILS